MIDNSNKETLIHNAPLFTVTEISNALKLLVEKNFERIRVRGEISGLKKAASGHIYFTLKDENTILDSICWRGVASKLSITPEDGLEVIVVGRITTYGARSKYQIIIDQMELAGEGALLKLLAQRKRQLFEEGLFSDTKKRPIPFLPNTIGIITSTTGAVIQDIIHRLNDRFGIHVIIWPVTVQGNDAANQITRAINGFNSLTTPGPIQRPDVIIVARGGGSLEDLWAFNEEIVVRAAASSKIPLISAVGHETDTTLIDYASDKRAPTPSAAAEMSVPVKIELITRVANNGRQMANSINRIISEFKLQVRGIGRGLPNPLHLIDEASQRIDDWGERLYNSLGSGMSTRVRSLVHLYKRLRHPKQILAQGQIALKKETLSLKNTSRNFIRENRYQLDRLTSLLESYSYERVLERGFVLIRDKNDQPIFSAKKAIPGEALTATFKDGIINIMVSNTKTIRKQ